MNIDRDNALSYVLEKMEKEQSFIGIEKEDMKKIVASAIDLDLEYMDKKDVSQGEVYDEDDAFDHIMEILCKGLDDENKMLVSLLVDGYFEYFDMYLEENDLIDWQ